MSKNYDNDDKQWFEAGHWYIGKNYDNDDKHILVSHLASKVFM